MRQRAALTSHSISCDPPLSHPVAFDGRVICKAEAVKASASARTVYLATILVVLWLALVMGVASSDE